MTSKTAPLIYATVVDTAGNSQRITEQTHRVTKLTYTDSEVKADKACLMVENFDLGNFDDPVWAHKNLLRLSWGYPGNMAITRELVITKVTGFLTLKVEAKAKSVLMATEKKSRSFKSMTRSDAVTQIAAEYGYTAALGNVFIQQTGTRYEHITQPRFTDAQMLRKLAHLQGYEFYVDHTGFHWHERKLFQDPARVFTWYLDYTRSDVLDIQLEADITRRPKEVKRVSLDTGTNVVSEGTASDSADADREGLASIALIASDDLKTASLQYDYEVNDTMMCVDNSPPAVAAKRHFRKTQRGAVKLELKAIGDPSYLAKTVFGLAGVGKRLSGNYYASEVTHDVAPGSYHMQIKCLSDGLGPFTKRAAPIGENGLPEVTPAVSSAKRPDAAVDAHNTGFPVGQENLDPSSLDPVPVLDAEGNEIGTGFTVRKTSSTVILGGGLATVED